MSKNNKPRPYLGKRAIEIASRFVEDGEAITGAHLESAILELEQKASQQSTSQTSVSEAFVREELDLLHHELSEKIIGQKTALEPQLKSIAVSLDTIRLMLNIFGEEQTGADTSDLFKEARMLMDEVLQPLAQETRERAPEPNTKEGLKDLTGLGEHGHRDDEDGVLNQEDPDLETNGHSIIPGQDGRSAEHEKDQGRGR